MKESIKQKHIIIELAGRYERHFLEATEKQYKLLELIDKIYQNASLAAIKAKSDPTIMESIPGLKAKVEKQKKIAAILLGANREQRNRIADLYYSPVCEAFDAVCDLLDIRLQDLQELIDEMEQLSCPDHQQKKGDRS